MPDYADDALVYVDPRNRTVIGPVEWGKDEKPVPLEMEMLEEDSKPSAEASGGKEAAGKKFRRRKKDRKRYYPWGTYRTMKRLYRIEGKERDVENYITLDEAIAKSMEEPYWN